MKNPINWKLFFILLAASFATTLMVMPYAFTLIKETSLVITPIILVAQVIQSALLFSLAIFIGLKLAKRVGFGLPILEGLLKGESQKEKLKSILWQSIGLGILAGVLIILFSIPFGTMSIDFLKAEISVPTWKSFLASFYGGIGEEILMRLFLMTFFVWISFKIKQTAEGKPTVLGVWLAIILSSIIFGLGHLPITSGLTAITSLVITRAIVLNGIGGVIFGWLYWKKGLEAAMISHFSADISLHVILPLVASRFV